MKGTTVLWDRVYALCPWDSYRILDFLEYINSNHTQGILYFLVHIVHYFLEYVNNVQWKWNFYD